ncbi:SH3 and cysteine-rich domain-containing protein-like isoform X1 [Lampetra fluviatilis]
MAGTASRDAESSGHQQQQHEHEKHHHHHQQHQQQQLHGSQHNLGHAVASPVTMGHSQDGHHESKLQRLKRSLSFKTKSLRSRSADNVFERSDRDSRGEGNLILTPALIPNAALRGSPSSPPPPPPLPPASRECLLGEARSSRALLSSSSSSSSSSSATTNVAAAHPPPSPLRLFPGERQHDFQEHVFKKPTFCDICNHMIVDTGSSSKHGLRCKACKLSLHHRCLGGVEMQRCMGKMPKGFRRHYSSPLLINEQFSCIMEVIPLEEDRKRNEKPCVCSSARRGDGHSGCGKKVDPVYETLRFGTSLAQRVKGRGCEGEPGPCRHSSSMDADLMDVPEEMDMGGGMPSTQTSLQQATQPDALLASQPAAQQTTQPATNPDAHLEGPPGTQPATRADSQPEKMSPAGTGSEETGTGDKPKKPTPVRRGQLKHMESIQQMYQYVALSQYVPQDSGDLAIQPGDILSIVDDSNEEWWKGRIDDRVGFFPANFVQRVRPGERVFRCVRACAGTREHGHLALNLEQICVEKASMPSQGLVRVQSGRKKGLVPIDCLEEI